MCLALCQSLLECCPAVVPWNLRPAFLLLLTEDAKLQRRYVTCSRSHSYCMMEVGVCVGTRPCSFYFMCYLSP